MVDRTAAHRVKRYRSLQKGERGIVRVEVQVPAAKRQVDFVLGTVNAPRPHPIDAKTLVRCLTTSRPDARWRPHIEALFDEVSPEAIHDLVLAGVVTFEDLYRAARTWSAADGGNVAWIKEMADLRLARSAA
jgi:hypothetical protein